MYRHYFKSRTVFLVGFGIGFLLALLFFAVQDVYNSTLVCKESLPSPYAGNRDALLKWFMSDTLPRRQIGLQAWKQSTGSANSTYERWLESRQLRPKDIDLDVYLYGPERKEETAAGWLNSNVRITCVVFVKKIKLARSIQNTWGSRCSELYFFGQVKSPEVPIINFDMKLVSSWQLLCEAFSYIWKDDRPLEWVIFVKDDTLVIPENLRYMLGPLNHTEDHYLGHAVVMWGQPYNVADAGYVISVGVLRKLIKMFDSSQKCLAGGKYWKQEDYYLAKHLASMGIYPSDTRDDNLRGTFHGHPLQSLLWGIVKTSVYWTRAMYPIKTECCSFISVTFNVGEPDKMYTLNYLLYHLHVLNGAANFGSRKAATSVPDEDVWKVALKEEFNITDLNDISPDAYYEMWHSKYSEPGQLIAKNNRIKEADKLP